MPVRTAYAPVAGEVLTAVNLGRLPGGWIGYAEVTANQAAISAVVDLTGLTVSVTVGASRRIRITGSTLFNGTTLDDSAQMQIREGATQLQIGEAPIRTSFASIERSVIITPTAGAHTYKLMAARNVGTGSVTLGASATNPAFILVEDLGPAT